MVLICLYIFGSVLVILNSQREFQVNPSCNQPYESGFMGIYTLCTYPPGGKLESHCVGQIHLNGSPRDTNIICHL